ncbi:MAG: hypothetical protein U0998_06060 [Moraxellaceae bacterium]|nr:hypothetical protein [Moraxellaceae bacterium]MDZ4386767.1 hypothetical protein [Moraxellaceae bacterium]
MYRAIFLALTLSGLFGCAPLQVYQKPQLPDSKLSLIEIQNLADVNAGFWTFQNNIECKGVTVREMKGNIGSHGITKNEVVEVHTEINKPFSIYIEFFAPKTFQSWKELKKVLTFNPTSKRYKLVLLSEGNERAGFNLYEQRGDQLLVVPKERYIVRDWVQGWDWASSWCQKATPEQLRLLQNNAHSK